MTLFNLLVEVVHLQPQTPLRLNGNKPPDLNLAIRLRDLEAKAREQRREETLHLQPRKALPNATARAVQERDECVRAVRAAGRSFRALKPPFWLELSGIGAPDGLGAVDGPDGDSDLQAVRDRHIADHRGYGGLADGAGGGGVETQGLVADGCQYGHLFGVEV